MSRTNAALGLRGKHLAVRCLGYSGMSPSADFKLHFVY